MITAENQAIKKSREEILKLQQEANVKVPARRRFEKGVLVV